MSGFVTKEGQRCPGRKCTAGVGSSRLGRTTAWNDICKIIWCGGADERFCLYLLKKLTDARVCPDQNMERSLTLVMCAARLVQLDSVQLRRSADIWRVILPENEAYGQPGDVIYPGSPSTWEQKAAASAPARYWAFNPSNMRCHNRPLGKLCQEVKSSRLPAYLLWKHVFDPGPIMTWTSRPSSYWKDYLDTFPFGIVILSPWPLFPELNAW